VSNIERGMCMWGDDPQHPCDQPATKLVILHETVGDRVLDMNAWVCDRHYQAASESYGAGSISF
jgi:hypothetical protein